MSEHPTPAELDAFLEGSLAEGRMRAVARHILTGCSGCRAALAPLYEPAEEEEEDYDGAIDRAFHKVLSDPRVLYREEARRRDVAAKLAAAGSLQAFIDETDTPLQGLETLKALLARSWALRLDDPREMVCHARAAVNVARNLNPGHFPSGLHEDLQAWAWGELANALRVRDDLDEAERAFGIAFELLLQGTGDRNLKARLYDLHASYLGTRRQFDLAFEALDIAYSTYVELGDLHLAGKTRLAKALYTHYSGDPEEAMRLNEEGQGLVEKGLDPLVDFSFILNQLVFLMAAGRYGEAKKALFLHRKDLQRCTGRIYALRIRYLQGQISAGLEEWKSAEEALSEAKDGFSEHGMAFAAALASLELALVWMRQNRYAEAEELALGTVEVFVTLRIRREAFGALMILKDAFEKRTATVALLEDVVDFLRRSEIDPDIRFVSRGQ